MRAHIELRLRSRHNRTGLFSCPSCAAPGFVKVDVFDPAFPISAAIRCACSCVINATVLGFDLNPTGELPAVEDAQTAPHLTDLERRLASS